MPDTPPPLVIVLTGPSGVGKDAVFDQMVKRLIPMARPATMTTRAPRPGEDEGVHHYFVTPEAFERAFAAGELLERSGEYGKQYGVPRHSVRTALATGDDVVIRVDVRGAESLRELIPGALFICLMPQRVGDLVVRLDQRATEDAIERVSRLEKAPGEIERAFHFCSMVVNPQGRLDETVDEILRLMDEERRRPGRPPISV
jgi:guanylate kinase